MKSAKDYWDEWSIPEVHGSPPNGWNNLIEAIRDEMREECAMAWQEWDGTGDMRDAIRNAGREPRFKPGQLVKWKGGCTHELYYGPYSDLDEWGDKDRATVESVLDIHGKEVYLPVEGAKS